MKKSEYIERYGEEKWAERIEKNKKRYWKNRDRYLDMQKKYREQNKDYFQKYRENHKEELKEQTKLYRELHKEKKKEYDKKYYELHLEELKEKQKRYNKQWYEVNSEKLKQERNTKFGRAVVLKRCYINFDKGKGFSIDQIIDENWIIDNIFNASCVYCGDTDWMKLGADRIDNSKGHTPDNCVCACNLCNKARGNRYSIQEFIALKQKKM